jgi:hypothetical protein
MVWIWQHDKKTDDNKIILKYIRKLILKINEEKRPGKVQTKKKNINTLEE